MPLICSVTPDTFPQNGAHLADERLGIVSRSGERPNLASLRSQLVTVIAMVTKRVPNDGSVCSKQTSFSLWFRFETGFYTDRSKAVLLLWFLTVTCSCCPYLYLVQLLC